MVMGELVQDSEVVVIGAGPGGYAAAFRAADLGMDVTLIDTAEGPGGVCLFRGCIPSKTYLHLSELLHDVAAAKEMGIAFGRPEIDIPGVRRWKETVVGKLAGGLVQLADQRGIQRLRGRAEFVRSNEIRIHGSDISGIRFQHAVIATGSRPIPLPGGSFEKDGRIMSSTAALALPDIPGRLLVVGGGYVGLEIGMIYAALGSEIHLVEMGDRLLPGIDADLVAPLARRLDTAFQAIHLNTRVETVQTTEAGVQVSFSGDGADANGGFDRVLVAIGRAPNTRNIGLENTGVETDERGFIRVDDRQQTADKHILAVGDVTGGMMLAHKASREGKVAAEVMAGEPSAFDARAIPAVVYTDPQIACCGLDEATAARENRTVEVRRFPWKYSGRALTMGTGEGMTKIIADPASQRILGIGIVGRGAEGLISEGVLAVEMGALVEDVAFTIHPHPTLSETEGEAAEIFLGSALHVPPKKK